MSLRLATTLALLGCSSNAQSISLNDLFAAPTADELAEVEADWATRDTGVYGWQVEATGQLGGFSVTVVSHQVGGYRHYGLIRYPRNFVAGGSFPVLLHCHGGNNGVGYGGVLAFDSLMGGSCVPDDFFIVVPSYRGESLMVGALGTFLSEGPTTTLDYDVDDTMALLGGVLANVAEADASSIACWGASRGGGVTLLLGVRDDRIIVCSEFYGASNHMLSSIQADCEDLANNVISSPPNPVVNVAWTSAASPYVSGTMTLAEARHALIARSAALFAERLPRMQAHHGTADFVVPIEQTYALDQAMQALGVASPTYESFVYQGGVHTPPSLTGSGALTQTLLCGVTGGSYGTFGQFGAGCTLSAGDSPALGITGSLATAGHVQARIENVPSGLASLFVFGFSQTTSNIGGSCDLLVNSAWTSPIAFVSSAGTVGLRVEFPPTPLASGTLFVQGFVSDSNLSAFPGFAATSGGTIVLP